MAINSFNNPSQELLVLPSTILPEHPKRLKLLIWVVGHSGAASRSGRRFAYCPKIAGRRPASSFWTRLDLNDSPSSANFRCPPLEEHRMKTLAMTAAALLLIAGCSAGKTPIASVASTTSPTVVFIGDSITALWASGQEGPQFEEHPTWIAKGISGQNSNQLLARFQTDVIDLHPDVVHILIGTNDVYPGWTLGPSEVTAFGSVFAIDSSANVTAMVQMAQAAGIKVILATIPPWETDPITVGDIAYDADSSVGRYALIDIWNTWLRQYAFDNGIPLADYHTALAASNSENYITDLTIDGVHPSMQGYLVMTPLAEVAITSATELPAAP
jgi:lysophospholipase L1-like esterase